MATASKAASKSRKTAPQRAAAAAAAAANSGDALDLAQKIAWYAILTMVFLVPIVMSNYNVRGTNGFPLTFDQFDTIKVLVQRVGSLIAFAAWGWYMLVKGGKIRRTPVDWLVLVFLGWVALSAIFSIHPPTAVFGKYRRYEGLLSFINYAVAYFLVIQFADRGKRLRQLAQVAFWSAVVVSTYGVMQFLGLDFLQWGQLPFEPNRAFSTYGNPDLLGGFIVLMLPVALALVFAAQDLKWRVIYWVGFFLIAWCWLVAFTRGAWIGGIAALLVMAFGLFWLKPRWQKVDWAAVALVAVMAVGVVSWSLNSPYEVTNFVKRFASIFDVQTGSGQTRTQIWQAALGSIEDRPITGFGADTFRLVFPKYKPAEYVQAAGYISVADNVHNYPLQLASGIGIPGVLLLYGLFVWVAIRSGKVVFKRPDPARAGPTARRPASPAQPVSGDRLVLLGMWAACFGYIASLSFGLSVTGGTFILWVFLGALLAPTATSRDVTAPSWGIYPAVALVILAVIGSVFWFRWFAADRQYLVARISPDLQTRVTSAQNAVRLNPWNDMYRAEVGLAYNDLFIQAYQQAFQAQQTGQDSASLQAGARDAFTKAEDSLRGVIAFVPYEYDNYVFLASLYNLGAQVYNDPALRTRAIDISRQGVEVEPFGPAIRLQLATALAASGKRAEAIKELEFAVKLDSRFFDGAILLAKLYGEEGRFAEAKKLLDATGAEAAAVGNADVSAEVSSALAAIEASANASGGSSPTTP